MMSEKQKNTPQEETRSALSRLVVVLAVAIGLIIYSYGWTVTEIDLSEPQEEQRQENVTRALRELLSPRLFQQEREVIEYDAPFLMDCTTGDAPQQAERNGSETIVIIEPACSDANEQITVQIINGTAGADARLRWIPPAEEGEDPRARPLEIIETEREDLVLDGSGGFTGSIEVPRIRRGEGQIHTLRVLVAIPAGQIEFSETALIVIDRMIQTIFMALVATTVAIPIASLISFFAAQNLMRRVRLTVGSMMMAVILFASGIWLGTANISLVNGSGVGNLAGNEITKLGIYSIGELGLFIGQGDLFEPIGAMLAFVIPIVVFIVTGWVLARIQAISTIEKNPALQVLNAIITVVVLIFLLGALGGLGILGGEQITALGDTLRPTEADSITTGLQDAFGFSIWTIGNLLLILSEMIELFIRPITGAILGFVFASLGASILGNGLRRIRGVPSHVLAGIMGAIAGAILLVFLARIALWASLLGILPVLISSIIGGQVLSLIWKRLTRRRGEVGEIIVITNTQRAIEWVVFAIGAVGIFVLMFNTLNLGRTLVDGTLPPQTTVALFGIDLGMTNYVFTAMLYGAILAGIGTAITGLQGTFPLGTLLYNTSRTSLNAVRSIEPLIMGLVFVIWVGIGPFAGVLALTLHSIAALGKLYSEQIENIDAGPIEALESTGANQLQTIIYAVVPQIIPPYIAFTMYRWDINVRMSTIIGFVGGGGIGLLLQQQINLLRYRDAGVAVLAIAVVVSVLDYASAYIRERVL
ncbi:MAG: ABC transporter permease subunit [Chloroflexota bacterium]